MAEYNKKLFTESFELVVDNFYNAVEAASPLTKSTDDAAEIDIVARAIVQEFNGSMSLNEIGERKETASSIEDVPVTAIVDRTGTPEVIERESSEDIIATVQSPESPPPGTSVHESPVHENDQVAGMIELQTMPHNEICGKTFFRGIDKVYFRTWNPSHVIDFEWALENFSQYVEDIHGSNFAVENCEKAWQASIVMKKNQEGISEYLELHMEVLHELKEKIHAHFSLGMYNTRGECLQECVTVTQFTEDQRDQQCLVTKNPYFRSSDDNVGLYLYDDELIIKGHIKLTGCCLLTERFAKPKLETT